MADDTGDIPRGNDPLEKQKLAASEALLNQSLRYVESDNRLNDMLNELLSVIVGEVKRDPSVLFSNKNNNNNIEALLSALKKRPEGGDISGGDIVGGAASFGDVVDFIKAIGELAAEEKKFFLKIIFLIFCDCDCVCKCLCD